MHDTNYSLCASLDPTHESRKWKLKLIQPKKLTPSPSSSKASLGASHLIFDFYF
jgi:hypothetical protein